MYKRISIGLIFTLVMVMGCTNKKNPIGFQGGVQPQEIIFESDIFNTNLSFVDSTFNYIPANTIVIGNYDSNEQNKELRTLLKFTNLPDSILTIESEIKLSLPIKERYNFANIDETNLKIGLVESYWYEYDVTWYSATDSTEWLTPGGDFTEIENDTLDIYAEEDTIYIKLPQSTILNWIESDSTNYGLVLYTESQDAFLELYGSEYSLEEDGLNPVMKFDYYLSNADTTLSVYEGEVDRDAFIYSYDELYNCYDDQLILSNIRPIRIFVEFDFTDSMFINIEGSNIMNADDFRRMTINRAEIILHRKEDDIYPLNSTLTTSGYNLLTDSLYFDDNSIPLVGDGDYESLGDGTNADSLNADNHKINITNILQYYCGGGKENYGILIRSIYENKDLTHISFATKDDPDLEKRPQLKIIYTPPYLDN